MGRLQKLVEFLGTKAVKGYFKYKYPLINKIPNPIVDFVANQYAKRKITKMINSNPLPWKLPLS